MTNFRPLTGKLVKVYAGRCDAQNRIEEGRGPLRWDKTSCHRFAANHAPLLMGVVAYSLLHMLRQLSLIGEEVNQSISGVVDKATDKSRRQGILSCKEMACSCDVGVSLEPRFPCGIRVRYNRENRA